MRAFLKKLWPEDIDSEGRFSGYEVGVLLTVCLGLAFIQFVGGEVSFRDIFGSFFLAEDEYVNQYQRVKAMKSHQWYGLLKLTHWSVCCLIGYVLVPVIFLKVTKRSLREMHLSMSGTWQHRQIYIVLALIMLPPVILISFEPEYQNIYPFYDDAGRSLFDLVVWECLYLSQFFALEFFFRGFMVSQLRRWAGQGAVFIMVIPYCMIHFPKTASETLGAIIAGIVLGSLALRGRSIWGGVFLHCGVALTMDLMCLYHAGSLTRLL